MLGGDMSLADSEQVVGGGNQICTQLGAIEAAIKRVAAVPPTVFIQPKISSTRLHTLWPYQVPRSGLSLRISIELKPRDWSKPVKSARRKCSVSALLLGSVSRPRRHHYIR